jgi:hypothetical protein
MVFRYWCKYLLSGGSTRLQVQAPLSSCRALGLLRMLIYNTFCLVKGPTLGRAPPTIHLFLKTSSHTQNYVLQPCAAARNLSDTLKLLSGCSALGNYKVGR